MILLRAWFLSLLGVRALASELNPWHSFPLISLQFSVFIAPFHIVAAAEKRQDFYEVLGVDKKATKLQIKSAYRKLALKWHPDKHKDDKEKATETFRKIAEAYEVLNNEQSRAQWDKFGTVGDEDMMGEGGGPGGFDGSFEDFLKNAGFDFGFHQPDEVFENAFQDIDVNQVFKTIFDENNKPVQPDKLKENEAISQLREAASMGANFEFEQIKKAKDGTSKRLVFRSDGEGSFSAYSEALDENGEGERAKWAKGQQQGDGQWRGGMEEGDEQGEDDQGRQVGMEEMLRQMGANGMQMGGMQMGNMEGMPGDMQFEGMPEGMQGMQFEGMDGMPPGMMEAMQGGGMQGEEGGMFEGEEGGMDNMQFEGMEGDEGAEGMYEGMGDEGHEFMQFEGDGGGMEDDEPPTHEEL